MDDLQGACMTAVPIVRSVADLVTASVAKRKSAPAPAGPSLLAEAAAVATL